jgi:protein-S-isoprenylcysteine O-methyltransferase Ste14
MDIDVKALTGKFVILFLIIALALFLPAGTIKWTAGWVFLLLFFGFSVAVTVWLYRHDPALLKERAAGFQPDQKAWDKVLLVLAGITYLAWLVIMPLDAVRFHWSRMPIWLQVVGAISLLISFYLIFLTLKQNPYLSSVVRLQKDRGHTVVSTGLYHYVRHPMYAACIPLFLGSALLLGSWFGILIGLILMGIMAVRAVLEERTLREELPGYAAYMAQVRYRFLPYVW